MKFFTPVAFCFILFIAVGCKPTDSNLEETYGDLDNDDNVQNDNNNEDSNDYEPDDEETVSSSAKDSAELEILTRGQEFEKSLGESVELPCNIKGSYNVQIWKKETLVLFQGESSLGAAKLDMSFSANNGSLHIPHLQERDWGTYECQALLDENNKPSIKHVIKWRTIAVKIEVKDTTLKVGETLTMKCIAAGGDPKPHISWHKGAERLGVEGDTLIIEKVRHHDAGVYRCFADNKVAKPGYAQVEINIDYKPIVSIEKISVCSDEKLSTELKCMVHSHPTAQVVWKKDGKNIKTTERTEFMTHDNDHILLLKDLKEGDFGQYTCSAVNYIGETKRNIKLVKTPAVLRFLKPHTDSKDVVLAWEVQSKIPISQHELSYRKKGENEWKMIKPEVGKAENELYTVKYTLNGLEPGVYETRVRSQNGNGWSEYSEIVPFEGVIAKGGQPNNKHKKYHHKEAKHSPSKEVASTPKTLQEEVRPREHNEVEAPPSPVGAKHTPPKEGASTPKNLQEEVRPAEHNEAEATPGLVGASESSGSPTSHASTSLFSIVLVCCLAIIREM